MKINVYAANLLRRMDRRASLQKQFAGRSEFALRVVPAVEMDNGAWGLWQTFCQIAAEEAVRNTAVTLNLKLITDLFGFMRACASACCNYLESNWFVYCTYLFPVILIITKAFSL